MTERPLTIEDFKRESDRIFDSDVSDSNYIKTLAREFGVMDWQIIEFISANTKALGWDQIETPQDSEMDLFYQAVGDKQ